MGSVPKAQIRSAYPTRRSESLFSRRRVRVSSLSEYPGKSSGLWLFIGVLHLLPGTAPGKDPDLLCRLTINLRQCIKGDNMKIYFPSYYKQFKCIADKCRHSCCVGWEIDVDDATMEKYKLIEGDMGDDIRAHICDGVISLCDDERCPFLDCRGLCKIIYSLGEGYISDICREHPRFYHSISGRVEGGLGAVCEEACRIILSSDGYADFIELEQVANPPEETDLDTLSDRAEIYKILLDKNGTFAEKTDRIRQKYDLSDLFNHADRWNEALLSLEYLDSSRIGRLAIGKRCYSRESDSYLTRFLAYLIFRHVSVADSKDNLIARVGFCLLLSAIFENMIADGDLSFEEIAESARILSEEIEYSEDNTASLIFDIECEI